ncbi:hypothetical protein SCA6_006015 [Theobroma cacao]
MNHYSAIQACIRAPDKYGLGFLAPIRCCLKTMNSNTMHTPFLLEKVRSRIPKGNLFIILDAPDQTFTGNFECFECDQL